MEIIEPLKENKHKQAINSFFSDCITLEGNVNFDGSVRIDCEMQGKIKCNITVFAGRYSKVHGDIETNSFVCEGEFRGQIHSSDTIHIAKSGNLMGEIKTPRFTIEEGGFFEGVCQILKPKMKNKNHIRKVPKNPISILDET